MTKIKPCPFCGSKNIGYSTKKRNAIGYSYYVVSMYCKDCGAYGPTVLTEHFDHYDYDNWVDKDKDPCKEQAINCWNKRM